MDPVWNIPALSSHDGTDSHATLLLIPTRMVDTNGHLLSHLQPSIDHTLLVIVDLLAGQEIAEHVFNFMIDFELLVRIPRYILDEDN